MAGSSKAERAAVTGVVAGSSPALPATIYRVDCPTCGMVLTAMSKGSLAESLHTHQEACPSG